MPVKFPGSSLEPDCHSCPVCTEVKGSSQMWVTLYLRGKYLLGLDSSNPGRLGSKVKRGFISFIVFLPSLTTASAVWCGRPVNTWTAGAPRRCRHTFPRYPGPSCTPAMILLGLLATPEEKEEKEREAGSHILRRRLSITGLSRRRHRSQHTSNRAGKEQVTKMLLIFSVSGEI